MRIVLILAASLTLGTALAGSYKWTDENGKVHYTQTPPPAGSYQDVTSAPATPQAKAPSSYQRALEAHQRLEQREQAAQEQLQADKQQAKIAAARAQNCQTAQREVKSLTTYRQILIEKNGEMVRMTEPERQQQLEAARAKVAEYCN